MDELLQDKTPPTQRCKRPKKRGGGGAWRTYVHEQVHSGGFSKNMTELAQQYRALPREERSRLEELGKEASLAHARGVTSYPIRSRRRRYARGHGHEVLPAESKKPHIPLRANLISDVASGQSVTLPAALAPLGVVVSSADHFRQLVRGLTLQCQETTGPSSMDLQDMAKVVKDYSEKMTPVLLQDRRCLEDLSLCKWEARPHSDACAHLECRLCPEALASDEADLGDRGLPLASGLSVNELCEAWRSSHVMVKEESWTVPDRAPKKQPCWQHHCCHCKNSRGSFLKQVYGRVAGFLKARCKDPIVEQMFLEGSLILEWCVAEVSGDAAEPEHLFTLIPLAYLRPWRPTFARLVLEAVASNGTLPVLRPGLEYETVKDEEAWLQVASHPDGACALYSIWEWLQTFDFQTLHRSVVLSLWHVSKRPRPATSITGRVRAVRMCRQLGHIWSGIAVEQRRGRRNPQDNAMQVWEDDETEIQQDAKRLRTDGVELPQQDGQDPLPEVPGPEDSDSDVVLEFENDEGVLTGAIAELANPGAQQRSSSSSSSSSTSSSSSSSSSSSDSDRPQGPLVGRVMTAKAPSTVGEDEESRVRDRFAAIPFGMHSYVKRYTDGKHSGYVMACHCAGHVRCSKEMSGAVAGSLPLCLRILKAWVLMGHAHSDRGSHMSPDLKRVLLDAAKNDSLFDDEALEAAAETSQKFGEVVSPVTATWVSPSTSSSQSSSSQSILGRKSEKVSQELHSQMEEWAREGKLPLTTASQRSRNSVASASNYEVPTSLRACFLGGYIHPNLGAPAGLQWQATRWHMAPCASRRLVAKVLSIHRKQSAGEKSRQIQTSDLRKCPLLTLVTSTSSLVKVAGESSPSFLCFEGLCVGSHLLLQ